MQINKLVFTGVIIVLIICVITFIFVEKGIQKETMGMMTQKESFDHESADMIYFDGMEKACFKIEKNVKLYKPGEKIKFLLYSNFNESDINIEVNLVNKITNEKESKSCILLLEKTYASFFIQNRNGICSIEFVVFKSQKEVYRQEISVGVLPEAEIAASNSGFWFGVQPFLSRIGIWNGYNWVAKSGEDTYKLVWDYINYIGVNLIRDCAQWNNMQKAKDGSLDFTVCDKIIKDAFGKEILVNFVFGGTPEWAIDKGSSDRMGEAFGEQVRWNLPPSADLWVNDYVKPVTERYKDYSNIIYEIRNEENSEFWAGTPEEYNILLEKSAKAIKAVSQQIPVIPGGMVSRGVLNSNTLKWNDITDDKYYKKFKELLDEKLIDYVAWHGHGPFSVVTGKQNAAIQEYTNKYDIPQEIMLMNECGYYSQNNKKQAQEVIRKALFMFGNRCRMFVLYMNSAFEGTQNSNGMPDSQNWAMINEKGEPRDLYICYGNLIRQLDGTSLGEVISNENVYAYQFNKDGKSILVGFTNDNVKGASLVLNSNNKYEILDMYGNPIQNSSTVQLSVEPVYIVYNKTISAAEYELSWE